MKAKDLKNKSSTSNSSEVAANECGQSDDSVSISGEPGNSEYIPESPYSDLMISVALHLDGKADSEGMFAYIQRVFEIPDKEYLRTLTESKNKLETYRLNSIREYSKLMVKFLRDRFENSTIEPFSWNGALKPPASSVLVSHVNFRNMSEFDACFARWIALNEIQTEIDLDPQLFHQLIHVITEHDKGNDGKFCLKDKNQELARMFDRTVAQFLSLACRFVENLPFLDYQNGKTNSKKLTNIFTVLKKLMLCITDEHSDKIEMNFCELAIIHSLENGVFRFLQSTNKELIRASHKTSATLRNVIEFVTSADDKFHCMMKDLKDPFEK